MPSGLLHCLLELFAPCFPALFPCCHSQFILHPIFTSCLFLVPKPRNYFLFPYSLCPSFQLPDSLPPPFLCSHSTRFSFSSLLLYISFPRIYLSPPLSCPFLGPLGSWKHTWLLWLAASAMANGPHLLVSMPSWNPFPFGTGWTL